MRVLIEHEIVYGRAVSFECVEIDQSNYRAGVPAQCCGIVNL